VYADSLPESLSTGDSSQSELFYEDRFWEQYVGKNLVSDPVIAIVELVANCWDAGATSVDISWPKRSDNSLSISDNGEGMTKEEFYHRWGAMSYDRTRSQGSTVQVKIGGFSQQRRVFGRSGIGRFAVFCFSPLYTIKTCKRGTQVEFVVKKGKTQPLEFKLTSTQVGTQTGTTIRTTYSPSSILSAETIRTELGRRFLTDPAFEVVLNGEKIAFGDIEGKGLEVFQVQVPELNTYITIKIIDAKRTDPTGRLHGVAWHVLNRLVGDCGWVDPEQKKLIDGRRVEAKRFTFIVEADLLHDAKAVKSDWSGFDESNETFQWVNSAVQSAITRKLLAVTSDKRAQTTASVRASFTEEIRQMTPLKREKWNAFVAKVVEECPSLTEQELKSVSGILANMELAKSQYGLLNKLHDLSPDQIDDLHQILNEWTIDMAKIVLDEIRSRMKLIEELRLRTSSMSTLEVQDLQPLFRQGLWIFGPEFETIHYTSNEGMTAVIQNLFGGIDIKGSRNRPDFAILPDGTVGLYSYPEYDGEGGEIGPAKLVVIELKAPDVNVGDNEKSQCWKYIRELLKKGLLTERTLVQGFVLGRTINQVDRSERTELDGRIRILPLDYCTVLQRADSRLLKLRDKIKAAPFLQDACIDQFLSDPEIDAERLLLMTEKSDPSNGFVMNETGFHQNNQGKALEMGTSRASQQLLRGLDDE